MSLKYRADIDGLRGLAVILILIYHAKFVVAGQVFLQGAFVGVDIFFVISGYLISSILLKELNGNTLNLKRFYVRRIRRLLPMLFIVMFVTIPFAWHFMLPDALKEYAGSGLSTLFYGSNLWFLAEDKYMVAPSALKPLLHTWSLAIEE